MATAGKWKRAQKEKPTRLAELMEAGRLLLYFRRENEPEILKIKRRSGANMMKKAACPIRADKMIRAGVKPKNANKDRIFRPQIHARPVASN